MNLFEKLNRLDDSLVESKRVVKKKRLTESSQKKQLKEDYQVSAETWNNIKKYADLETTTGRDFAYDGPYADEVGCLYGAAIDRYNEVEGTNVEYQASIQNGQGASELFDDQGGYVYRDFETECDNLLDFAREATCLEDFMHSLVSYIYSFAEDLEYEEEDYDDDIDETLTEGLKGPGYAIKVWENPELVKKGMPTFDSIKKNKLYPDFDAVIKALQSSELSEAGAYEILWIKSGQEL